MVIIQEEKNFIITGIFFGLIANIDIGWFITLQIKGAAFRYSV